MHSIFAAANNPVTHDDSYHGGIDVHGAFSVACSMSQISNGNIFIGYKELLCSAVFLDTPSDIYDRVNTQFHTDGKWAFPSVSPPHVVTLYRTTLSPPLS
ncbi:MAG: hypothetical protein Q8O92_16140 [Candidatus Latescibacter sp.]|nr:hypothetical protein [Candidatus Latescibacter sp.]